MVSLGSLINFVLDMVLLQHILFFPYHQCEK